MVNLVRGTIFLHKAPDRPSLLGETASGQLFIPVSFEALLPGSPSLDSLPLSLEEGVRVWIRVELSSFEKTKRESFHWVGILRPEM